MKYDMRQLGGRVAAVLLVVALLPGWTFAWPGYLKRVDSVEDWNSIALDSAGIKYVVPGPNPNVEPGEEPVPGAEALPCLDFVVYGPGIQHIDIIRATRLDCVADFTPVKMNAMRQSMTQFAGYIAGVPDPESDAYLKAVTMHNDLFTDPEITPKEISYVMRQLRLTFNEAELGRLVYLPTTERAKDRARQWLLNPEIDLDFEIYFSEPVGIATFIRGDANGNSRLTISDPVATLHRLFVDRNTPIPCLDAADANDDGKLDLHDPMVVLRFLFMGGGPPAPPFPDPGPDPTADPWECERL